LRKPPFTPDDVSNPVDFIHLALAEVDDVIQRIADLAFDADLIHRHPLSKVPLRNATSTSSSRLSPKPFPFPFPFPPELELVAEPAVVAEPAAVSVTALVAVAVFFVARRVRGVFAATSVAAFFAGVVLSVLLTAFFLAIVLLPLAVRSMWSGYWIPFNLIDPTLFAYFVHSHSTD
jgi:hypothetical protein